MQCRAWRPKSADACLFGLKGVCASLPHWRKKAMGDPIAHHTHRAGSKEAGEGETSSFAAKWHSMCDGEIPK